MAQAITEEQVRRTASQLRDQARRYMVVDAVLKGHAAGLTVQELVDLAGETEESLVFGDMEDVARKFLGRRQT